MALGNNRAERPSVSKQKAFQDKIAQAGGYKDHADAMAQQNKIKQPPALDTNISKQISEFVIKKRVDNLTKGAWNREQEQILDYGKKPIPKRAPTQAAAKTAEDLHNRRKEIGDEAYSKEAFAPGGIQERFNRRNETSRM